MFASIRRIRRQIAVLTALSLLASVLVAVPAVAADDDPKQDYLATFSACDDAPSSGFEDVPSNHANAGDIDCIAYYGITKGTSATTYSPLMSVSREHMALFLTRLAGLVEIEIASDPADAGFTDIGDLSAESQTAINQLADLGITQGTSASTYSPGDSVTRGHMALFISRLMDLMDPMAENSNTVFGYTPEDVVDVADDADTEADESKTVKSPFTDLQSSTKEAYDAITALWELGVASGISATSYAPDASITRAAMAEFMAGVLDHSNARPAGVTIQASKTWAFGDINDSVVAVSYRDDSFAPMVDVSVKIFASGNDVDAGVGSFNEDGGCTDVAECAWTDDESLTDASGNIYETGTVSDGKTNTYYAWMGDADADENDFDVDTSPHATVTLSSTTDATDLKVTTDINSNSTNGNTEDIDGDGSVTITVQLVDGTGAAVAKSGVTVNIAVEQTTGASTVTLYPPPAPVKTDDDGQVTYTASGPKSTKGAVDVDRVDKITFTSDVDGGGITDDVTDPTDENTATGGADETVETRIVWTDSNPTLVLAGATDTVGDGSGTTISRAAQGSGKGSVSPYALRSGQGKVSIRASVSFYDQYGNSIGKNSKVLIDIGGGDPVFRTVSSRGMASWRSTFDADLNSSQTVTYALQDPAATDPASPQPLTGAPAVTGGTPVHVVAHADDDSSADADDIDAVYADENRFRIDGALYSYDSDDLFINDSGAADGAVADLDGFETLIGGNLTTITNAANIEIVAYDDDGSSIFRVVTAAS